MLGSGTVQYTEKSKKLGWSTQQNSPYAVAELPLEALILEIGGGQDPHPSSDVVVDKFLENNIHRCGGCAIQYEKRLLAKYLDGHEETIQQPLTLIQGDAVELPFRDKSFDFVITKDVLEHIPDIRKVLAEISRVGRGGYIDVPKLTSEYLFPQGEIHKWVFGMENGVFTAHSTEGFESPFGLTLHKVFAENPEVQNAWAKSRGYFHLVRFWQGTVDCVIGKPVVEMLN